MPLFLLSHAKIPNTYKKAESEKQAKDLFFGEDFKWTDKSFKERLQKEIKVEEIKTLERFLETVKFNRHGEFTTSLESGF